MRPDPPMTPSRLLTLSLATLLVVAAQTRAASADDAPQRSDLTPRDAARVAAVTRPAEDFSKAEAFELMQGGAGTSTHGVNQDAFSQFSTNITFAEEQDFKLGNALFQRTARA